MPGHQFFCSNLFLLLKIITFVAETDTYVEIPNRL